MQYLLLTLALVLAAGAFASEPSKIYPWFTKAEAKQWVTRFKGGDLYYAQTVAHMIRANMYSENELGLKPGELSGYESTARWNETHQWAVECRRGLIQNAGVLFIRIRTAPYSDRMIGLQEGEALTFAKEWLDSVQSGTTSLTPAQRQSRIHEIITECRGGYHQRAGYAFVVVRAYGISVDRKDIRILRYLAVKWVDQCSAGVLNPADLHQPPTALGMKIPEMSWAP